MKRLLIAAAILAMLATAHARPRAYSIGQTDQVTKGLVAYWAMRNSGTTIYDEKGTNVGTMSGAASSYANGVVGNGSWFDGTNDYISVGSPASVFNGTCSVLSLSYWARNDNKTQHWANGSCTFGSVNQESGSNQVRVVMGWDGASEEGVNILYNKGIWPVQYKYVFSTATALTGGQWYHIVCVLDVGTLANSKIYVNGAEKTSTTGSVGAAFTAFSSLAGNSLDMGSFSRTATLTNARSFFRGAIDEVRLYDRAVSDGEVKQLYRMGAIPKGIK
jgi:hypothetical protein